jgi:transcriptional regulator with XRE-family HTH domain
LSQRQLAELSSVTNGMISMVEQNRTSSSISLLKKILDELGISISEFFAVEAAMEETIFFRHKDLREITPPMANGEIKAVFKEVGDAVQHSLQLLYERYEPGADTGEDLYAHEAEKAGIIVEGHIEVTVGDRAQVLGLEDAYLLGSRLLHRFRNISNVACVVISACTPPTF